MRDPVDRPPLLWIDFVVVICLVVVSMFVEIVCVYTFDIGQTERSALNQN